MLTLLLLACSGGAYTTQGTKVSDFFPFDGERNAVYLNDDESVDWELRVEKIDESVVSGRTVVTMTYSQETDTALTELYAVKWSTLDGDSTLIHAYSEAGGAFTEYDPPISVTSGSGWMRVGDAVSTETGGYSFTSTFVEVVDCPVKMGLDWQDCSHFELDDGDGDPNAGPLFAGEYWQVTSYGTAWMLLTGYTDKWNLLDYDWEPDTQ